METTGTTTWVKRDTGAGLFYELEQGMNNGNDKQPTNKQKHGTD